MLFLPSVTSAGRLDGWRRASRLSAVRWRDCARSSMIRSLCGTGVRPTRLARELATPIREALQLLNESLRRERDYAPATSARTFHLNLNDYTQTILLPRLLAHLKELAPNVHLATTSFPVDEME